MTGAVLPGFMCRLGEEPSWRASDYSDLVQSSLCLWFCCADTSARESINRCVGTSDPIRHAPDARRDARTWSLGAPSGAVRIGHLRPDSGSQAPHSSLPTC